MAVNLSASGEDVHKLWEAYSRWRKLTFRQRVERYCREAQVGVALLRLGRGKSMVLSFDGSHGLEQHGRIQRRLKRTRWLRALVFARS